MKLTLIVISFSILTFSNIFSQSSNFSYEKEPRNAWGLNFNYNESGFGLAGSYAIPISNSTEIQTNLLISGVSDSREFEEFDPLGNTRIRDKENRVFMIPLSIGIQHYLFADDLEGNIKPLVSIGISPALIITTPYDQSYFKAFGDAKTSFAAGGYVGTGLEFRQSKNLSMSFNVRYYYLPVLGDEVRSISTRTIDDVGGLQLSFGINFLR